MAGHSGGISTGCLAVFLKHIVILVMYHAPAIFNAKILQSITDFDNVSEIKFRLLWHTPSHDVVTHYSQW
ncbi:hypothetical protein QL285_054604 [Trifolium repens]|nr:hypothetical protein QL285_054604 [Trifolium repens]